MAVVGICADIHGDLAGFERALAIFDREQVTHLICAGDIVDRGPRADAIVELLRARGVLCVAGNHERTVQHSQARWRASDRAEQLARVGRIISDATLQFIEQLPASAQIEIAGLRVMVAHGTPWSDVIGVYADSRPALLRQLYERYADAADLLILGHTHRPMRVVQGPFTILNPGSIYGVTMRDSATCATLHVEEQQAHLFSLKSGQEIDFPE